MKTRLILLVLMVIFASVLIVQGQTFTTLHSFNEWDGTGPVWCGNSSGR